jgi:hypothetical protein
VSAPTSLLEISRVCDACNAEHLFFVLPYQGRRLHSIASDDDDYKFRCRACSAPFFNYADDGDSVVLLLRSDPEVNATRERLLLKEAEGRASLQKQDDTGSALLNLVVTSSNLAGIYADAAANGTGKALRAHGAALGRLGTHLSEWLKRRK